MSVFDILEGSVYFLVMIDAVREFFDMLMWLPMWLSLLLFLLLLFLIGFATAIAAEMRAAEAATDARTRAAVAAAAVDAAVDARRRSHESERRRLRATLAAISASREATDLAIAHERALRNQAEATVRALRTWEKKQRATRAFFRDPEVQQAVQSMPELTEAEYRLSMHESRARSETTLQLEAMMFGDWGMAGDMDTIANKLRWLSTTTGPTKASFEKLSAVCNHGRVNGLI